MLDRLRTGPGLGGPPVRLDDQLAMPPVTVAMGNTIDVATVTGVGLSWIPAHSTGGSTVIGGAGPPPTPS